MRAQVSPFPAPVSYRAPPKPTEDRARQTEALIRERGTDLSRWAQPENLATQWDARAELAAQQIGGGQSVLDIGAGAMTLGRLLPPGSRYTPADVVKRREGCLVADLNRREFPDGTYDWVTFLGVLEYVHDVPWALERAAQAAPRLLATYCTHIGADVVIRRGMGWVNDFTHEAVVGLLAGAGWRVDRFLEVKRSASNVQNMYVCSRS